MCQEQTGPFSVACNAMLCSELAARSQLVGWLVDSGSPHAPPRLASPSRRERGECSAAEGHRRRRLRVRRRPAPPEPTGPRHRGRLTGDRPEEAQLCLHQEQLISQSGLPQCVRLSFTGREEEQLCLQHCPWTTTQPGRGQRLAGGDDKHSQPNAELAKGRQVRMPCAPVDSTPWMDLERHRVALLNKNSRHGSTMSTIRATAHTCYTVRGATRSDPQLLSIASSGSPECRMRCAIAHF